MIYSEEKVVRAWLKRDRSVSPQENILRISDEFSITEKEVRRVLYEHKVIWK